MAMRLRVLLIAAGLCSARLATAQDLAVVPSAEASRLSVRVQTDGSLVVSASRALIDEVVRAVAAAADIQVSTLGASPQGRVTVTFADAQPTRILRDLMEPAGISYVMSPGAPGRPGRLIMGVLASSTDRPAVTLDRHDPLPEKPGPTPENTTADAGQAPVTSPVTTQAPEPAEWPDDVQPVNLGPAVALPETRDALFQMVNGSLPVNLPAGFSPNPGGPAQIGPVNPIASNFGFSASGASSTPGAMATGGLAAPIMAIAPAPVDPSMLQAPRTIAIPAPVVVTFPPPDAP